jgi:hypothetical protein
LLEAAVREFQMHPSRAELYRSKAEEKATLTQNASRLRELPDLLADWEKLYQECTGTELIAPMDTSNESAPGCHGEA